MAGRTGGQYRGLTEGQMQSPSRNRQQLPLLKVSHHQSHQVLRSAVSSAHTAETPVWRPVVFEQIPPAAA